MKGSLVSNQQDNTEDYWVLQSKIRGKTPSKPAQKITTLSWSKKQQVLKLLSIWTNRFLDYDSFHLTNPIQLVIDIKNAVLFKKEHFEIINHAGVINLRATSIL